MRQRFSGERTSEILAGDGTEDLFFELVDRYILRTGRSGVQPKVLVTEREDARFASRTAELIIKSDRDEFPGLAINEYFCMSVARESGIPVLPR